MFNKDDIKAIAQRVIDEMKRIAAVTTADLETLENDEDLRTEVKQARREAALNGYKQRFEAFRKDAKNGEDPLESRFQTSISFENDGEKFEYNTTGYNIGLKKIYAIVDKGTASAAESILVGLMPYIPIVVIGGQTHGKFCTGLPLSADEWYTEMKKYLSNKYTRHSSIAENWGLYVMIATYADCNGENPCRPNGLTPAYTVEDVPENGIQIGDVNEPMLKKALELAGYHFAPKAAQSAAGAAVPAMEPTPSQVVSPAFGRRIRLLSALLDNES